MITKTLLGATVVLGGITFYKYETDTLEVTNYEIENSKIPNEFNNFRIVQISDLHNKSFGNNNKRLIEKIDSQKPDIIVITGDLVEGDNKNFDVALNLIDDLSKKYKVYHIIGNHEQKSLIKKYRDVYKEYFEKLYQKPIINLDNQKIKVEKKGQHINIYGLIIPLDYYPYFFKNYKNKNIKLEKSFIKDNLGEINENEYNVLLAHTPFFFEDYVKYGADLILAGHVHGGIIRLPIVGGLLSPNREFFPKYDFGKYEKDDKIMLLSKGLGGSRVLVRFSCKPEIVTITLKSK